MILIRNLAILSMLGAAPSGLAAAESVDLGDLDEFPADRPSDSLPSGVETKPASPDRAPALPPGSRSAAGSSKRPASHNGALATPPSRSTHATSKVTPRTERPRVGKSGDRSPELPASATAPEADDGAKRSPPPPITVGAIDGETEDKLTIVTIRLSGQPDWREPPRIQDHGHFLQVILPKTVVTDPGRFFDGAGPFLSKIVAYQLSASDSVVRLFVHGDASRIKAVTSAELLGDRVLVTIDHSRLPQPASSLTDQTSPATKAAAAQPPHPPARSEPNRTGPNRTESSPSGNIASLVNTHRPSAPVTTGDIDDEFVGPPAPVRQASLSADAVIAKTTVRRDIPPPSTIINSLAVGDKTSGPSAPESSTLTPDADSTASGVRSVLPPNPPNLSSNIQGQREHLIKLAVVSGLCLGLLVLLMGLRPWLRRRSSSLAALLRGTNLEADAAGGTSLSLRLVDSLAVAPRQRLALVKVGSEHVLIGVSPDSVSLLTVIGSQSHAQNATLSRPPSATPRAPISLGAPGSPSAATIEGKRTFAAKLPTANLAPALGASSPGRAPTGATAKEPPVHGQSARREPWDQRPRLKDLPGNDPETLSEADIPSVSPAARTRKVNIAIGDDGIANLNDPRPSPSGLATQAPLGHTAATERAPRKGQRPTTPPQTTNAVPTARAGSTDDVTRLIREKLRGLREL